MTVLQDFKNVLALLYIIPSLILYFIILYIIFFSSQKKNFSGSFYWIFGFSAVNYILQCITYYIVYRFTTIPAIQDFLETWPKENIWYIIFFSLTFYSATAIHTYSLVLSFNRVTIFFLKNKHVSFWRKYLKYILGFCVFAPLISIWNFPFIGIQNQPIDGLFVYIVPTDTNFAPWFQRSRNLFIEILFTSVSSLIMNFYVIYCIIKWRYSSTHQVSSQDVMMFVYSMLIFSTEAFSCMQQCMLAIDRPTFLDFVHATQFILADVSTLAPAWFILATNKQLREAISNLFLNSLQKNVIQISSAVPTPPSLMA